MTASREVWAVLPVKGFDAAKQRLANGVAPALRQRLAQAMVEDVIAALVAAPVLSGIAVVTVDPAATALAQRHGLTIISEGATEGQTVAVATALHVLAQAGKDAVVTFPGDIPLITPAEIAQIVAAWRRDREFIIVPAHDRRGSNAILTSPPGVVPLSFGNDSYLPHLEAARARGIEPHILPLPGIGLDIDNPTDLALFLQKPSATRAYALLRDAGVTAAAMAQS